MVGRAPLRGKELQKAIIALARRLDWRVAHFPTVQDFRGTWRTPVAADGKGFPDLILVRDRIIASEIKGDGDSLRADQEAWLAAFAAAGADTFTWRPKDWREGWIEEELKRSRSD